MALEVCSGIARAVRDRRITPFAALDHLVDIRLHVGYATCAGQATSVLLTSVSVPENSAGPSSEQRARRHHGAGKIFAFILVTLAAWLEAPDGLLRPQGWQGSPDSIHPGSRITLFERTSMLDCFNMLKCLPESLLVFVSLHEVRSGMCFQHFFLLQFPGPLVVAGHLANVKVYFGKLQFCRLIHFAIWTLTSVSHLGLTLSAPMMLNLERITR